jgi:hypothetical protein
MYILNVLRLSVILFSHIKLNSSKLPFKKTWTPVNKELQFFLIVWMQKIPDQVDYPAIK